MFCHFHRPVLENYDIWDQLRIDGGSEFTLTSKMQEFYSEFRNNKTRVSVCATKSVNVSDWQYVIISPFNPFNQRFSDFFKVNKREHWEEMR